LETLEGREIWELSIQRTTLRGKKVQSLRPYSVRKRIGKRGKNRRGSLYCGWKQDVRTLGDAL